MGLESALDQKNVLLAKIARGNNKSTGATSMIVQVRHLFKAKLKTTSEMKVAPLTLLIVLINCQVTKIVMNSVLQLSEL